MFVNMWTFANKIEMLNSHRCVIRKVSRCFRRKSAKNTNMGELINLGVVLSPGSIRNVLEETTARLGEHIASGGSYELA